MLHTVVMSVLLACSPFGAVEAYPQHRFGGMPVQFSFRTVHTPANFPVRPPVVRPSRLTLAQPAPEVPQPVVVQSHIPVMVSVPNDFVGDSVVVTSDDLSKMGLNGAMTNEEQPVEVVSPTLEDQLAPELSVVEEVAPVETVPEMMENEAVAVEGASSAGALSEIDESFVLTASEPQPEDGLEVAFADPMDAVVVDPVPELAANTPMIEPVVEPQLVEETPIEIVPETILSPEPIPELSEPLPTPTVVDEAAANTFDAYNQFLNTWLQLASVNLNRPDLLNLRTFIQPTAAPEPVQQIPVEEVNSAPLEPQQPTVAEETPVVDVVQEVASEAPVEITTEMAIIDAEPPTTPSDVVIAPQNTAESVVSEMVLPSEAPVEEVVVEEVASPIPEPAPVPVVEEISSNSIVDTVPAFTDSVISPQDNLISPQVDPVVKTVPRYTSRGRLAGFSYSFSHVPQRGTFFLHQQRRF